jgi:hypothetical protein
MTSSNPTVTSDIPSKTGRSYQFDMHQLREGDLLLWNEKWYTVQNVIRTPDAPAHRQVTVNLYSSENGYATAMGEETQRVTIIPRAFTIGGMSRETAASTRQLVEAYHAIYDIKDGIRPGAAGWTPAYDALGALNRLMVELGMPRIDRYDGTGRQS